MKTKRCIVVYTQAIQACKWVFEPPIEKPQHEVTLLHVRVGKKDDKRRRVKDSG